MLRSPCQCQVIHAFSAMPHRNSVDDEALYPLCPPTLLRLLTRRDLYLDWTSCFLKVHSDIQQLRISLPLSHNHHHKRETLNFGPANFFFEIFMGSRIYSVFESARTTSLSQLSTRNDFISILAAYFLRARAHISSLEPACPSLSQLST